MTLEHAPTVTAQMLIRRPASDVYQALIDPAVTTNFWFTRSSGRLTPGATVRWEWEMYGAAAPVTVVDLVPERRILLHWGEPARPLEFSLEARAEGTTLLKVSDSGFTGSDAEVVAQAIDSMGGFSSMLAGLKAWLEHGIRLNLVADHHPDAHVTGA